MNFIDTGNGWLNLDYVVRVHDEKDFGLTAELKNGLRIELNVERIDVELMMCDFLPVNGWRMVGFDSDEGEIFDKRVIGIYTSRIVDSVRNIRAVLTECGGVETPEINWKNGIAFVVETDTGILTDGGYKYESRQAVIDDLRAGLKEIEEELKRCMQPSDA